MDAVRIGATVVYIVVLLYMFVLFARLVMEYIPLFNRSWRPKGGALIAAEIVYTLTDPPIKFIRRFIPPLRIGQISIDLGFALTLLLVFIALSVARAFMMAG